MMVFVWSPPERLAITQLGGKLRIVTDAVAYLRFDRLLIFVRTRYTEAEPGPLRHQVELPRDWTVRKVESKDLRSWEVVEEDRK